MVSDMSDPVLSGQCLCEVFKGIMHSSCLSKVSLDLGYVTVAIVPALIAMVKGNKSLRELTLHGYHLIEELTDVVEAVVGEGRVERLVLRFGLVTVGRNFWRAFKRGNKALKTLHIQSVESWGGESEDLDALKEALAQDTKLEDLTLNVRGDAAEFVAKGLQTNKSVKYLDLGFCELGDSEAAHLAEMIRCNSSITNLIINLRAADEGIRDIAEAMKVNRNIKTLSLEKSDYTSEQLMWLADMLQHNSSLTDLNLKDQDEAYEDPTLLEEQAPGVLAIARALVGHKSLKVLSYLSIFEEIEQHYEAILMEGNGSLVSCQGFDALGERNRGMHERARQAVQAMRVLRLRTGEDNLNIFHIVQKDVWKMIARLVWESRCEIATWSTQATEANQTTKTKKSKIF